MRALLKCLSRVRGNPHARFLGGKETERSLTYPVKIKIINNRKNLFKQAVILLLFISILISGFQMYLTGVITREYGDISWYIPTIFIILCLPFIIPRKYVPKGWICNFINLGVYIICTVIWHTSAHIDTNSYCRNILFLSFGFGYTLFAFREEKKVTIWNLLYCIPALILFLSLTFGFMSHISYTYRYWNALKHKKDKVHNKSLHRTVEPSCDLEDKEKK